MTPATSQQNIENCPIMLSDDASSKVINDGHYLATWPTDTLCNVKTTNLVSHRQEDTIGQCDSFQFANGVDVILLTQGWSTREEWESIALRSCHILSYLVWNG